MISMHLRIKKILQISIVLCCCPFSIDGWLLGRICFRYSIVVAVVYVVVVKDAGWGSLCDNAIAVHIDGGTVDMVFNQWISMIMVLFCLSIFNL